MKLLNTMRASMLGLLMCGFVACGTCITSQAIASSATSNALALYYIQTAWTKYMLLASRQSTEQKLEIFDRAADFVDQFTQGEHNVVTLNRVNSLSAILKKIYPGQYRLQDEIDIFDSNEPPAYIEIEAQDTEGSDEIKKLQDAITSFSLNIIRQQNIPSISQNEHLLIRQLLIQVINGQMTAEISRSISNLQKLALIDVFERYFNSLDIQIENVILNLANSTDQKDIALLTLQYYKHLGWENKKEIFSQQIENTMQSKTTDPYCTFVEQFGALFKYIYVDLMTELQNKKESKRLPICDVSKSITPSAVIEKALQIHASFIQLNEIDTLAFLNSSVSQVHLASMRDKNEKLTDVVIVFNKNFEKRQLTSDEVFLEELDQSQYSYLVNSLDLRNRLLHAKNLINNFNISSLFIKSTTLNTESTDKSISYLTKCNQPALITNEHLSVFVVEKTSRAAIKKFQQSQSPTEPTNDIKEALQFYFKSKKMPPSLNHIKIARNANDDLQIYSIESDSGPILDSSYVNQDWSNLFVELQ